MSRWLGVRRLVLAAGFAAALPFIVSAAHALTADWTPYGDDAVIAVRSLDVFTGNSPLVGQWTSGPSEILQMNVYTPGPPLYWLLALPARLFAPEWMSVTMGLVNAACAVGAVALANRRGGRPLMFATAIAIPVMLASLPAESYSDVWNPSVPLPPLMLLVFLAWSVGCGEFRLLPLTVLVASFVAETHLSYVAPAFAATVIAVSGLLVSVRSRPPGDRGPVWRWAGAAALVAAVLWAPPLIDEATNSPGNLALLRIAATTGEPKLGIEAGLRAVVHTVGIPPWWLQGPNGPLEGIADVTTRPAIAAIGSAMLVLLTLAALSVLAVRRGRVEVLVATVLALALCAGVAFDAASTPSAAADTVHYTLRWASVAGMYAWLVVPWSLVRLFAPDRLRLRLPHVAEAAGLGLALLAGATVAIAASPPDEPFKAVRTTVERVDAELHGDGAVRVEGAHGGNGLFLAIDFEAALAYSLRRDGSDVVAPTIAELLGPAYEDGDYDQVVHVDVDTPPRRSRRVVARLRVRDTFESKTGAPHRVYVSLDSRGTERAGR